MKPAFTWLQPFTSQSDQSTEIISTDSEPAAIDILTDDCLEKVYAFCDMKTQMNLLHVDKRFNKSIRQFGFRTKKRIFIDFSTELQLKVRKLLQCVGRHMSSLRIIVKSDMGFRSLKHLNIQNQIGNNLRILKLTGFQNGVHLNLNQLNWQSIFDCLESLVIEASSMEFVDLQRMCPQLTMLELAEVSKFPIPCATWKKLQHFNLYVIFRSPLWNSGPSIREFGRFLKKNSQLKCVEFATGSIYVNWQPIVKYLMHVDTLCISANGPHYLADFDFLTTLHQLTVLRLAMIDFEDVLGNDISHILNLFPQMPQIRELEITWQHSTAQIDWNQLQERIAMLKEIPHLERLKLNGFTMKMATVFDIVRSAKHLAILAMRRGLIDGLNADTSQMFVEDLVKARKAHQLQYGSTEKLELIFAKDKCDILEAMQISSIEKVQNYFKINFR